MHQRSRHALILLTALTVHPRSAWPGWIAITHDPTTKIELSPVGLALETANEVQILDQQGKLVQRVSKSDLSWSDRPDTGSTSSERKSIDSLDVNIRDPHIEGRRVEHLLEDAQRLNTRRNRRFLRAQVDAPTLTRFTWTLDGQRLWAVSESQVQVWEGGLLRILGHSVDSAILKATNGQAIVGSERQMQIISRESGLIDEIRSEKEITRLAISTTGTKVAFAAGSTVTMFPNAPMAMYTRYDVRGRSLRDLGFCGETLLLLWEETLESIASDGQRRQHPLPAPASRILCSPASESTWVLFGQDFLVSVDGGEDWQGYGMPPSLPTRDVAATKYGAWIAGDTGVFFCPWDEWSMVGPHTARERVMDSQRLPKHPWWAWLTPKVTVGGQWNKTHERVETRGLVFASFPLEQTPIWSTASVDQRQTIPREDPGENGTRPVEATAHPLTSKDLACLESTLKRASELAFVEPERARSYLRRASNTAWLPEVRVIFDRRFGRSESLDYAGANVSFTSPLGIDTVNDVRYEARATWDLGRLVFAPEELAAQNQALRMAEQRRDVGRQVNHLFFEYQRLKKLQGMNVDKTPRSNLRQQEIVGELDILSGNMFSSCAFTPVEVRE